MELRHLRYFVEIVGQGSVSGAARALNVAQPALSVHLRNMEAELGTALVLRGRGGVRLTDAGELLLRHARRTLQEQSRIEDEIRNIGREPSGEVRLGLPGTISEILTVPLIERVRQRFPLIRLTASEAMSGFVTGWLRDSLVDLGVIYSRPDAADMSCLKLVDEHLVVIGAPDRLGGLAGSLQALVGQPLILPSRAHGLRRVLDSSAAALGLQFSPDIEMDSYENIKLLAIRGHGLSVLPLHAVHGEHMAGRLSILPLDPPLWREAWLVHRGASPLSKAVGAVHALVVEVARQLVRDGKWHGVRL